MDSSEVSKLKSSKELIKKRIVEMGNENAEANLSQDST